MSVRHATNNKNLQTLPLCNFLHSTHLVTYIQRSCHEPVAHHQR
jgi:hypothetical protein